MRTWVRRASILLMVLGLLIGALVATAWVLFRLYGPEFMRAELERALSSALGRPARVEAVMFRPWLAPLRVSHVSVPTNDSAAGAGPFSLEYADIGVRFESLWRRQLVLTISLTGLDVTTSSTGGDGTGLAALAFPATFRLGSVEVRIGRIRLQRGHLLHRDPAGGWTVAIDGI